MPRAYRVVKVPLSLGRASFLVVSEELDDPDIWVVINRCVTKREAWQYVREVEARNGTLARELGSVA